MKVNTKIRYGLRAMIEIASSPDPSGVLQKDIAKNQNLSVKYLDPIILSLKLKGLIVNYRGKGSGYVLARPASEISLLDIYTAFEPITVVDCVNNKEFCNRMDSCTAIDCWAEVKSEFEEILSKKLLSKYLS